MVTIEILQKSQRTRPRKWIPVFSLFAFLVFALVAVFDLGLVFSNTSFGQTIVKLLPSTDVTIGSVTLSWLNLCIYLVVPAALAVLGIIGLVVAMKISSYRHSYFALSWLLLLLLIAVILLAVFFNLNLFVKFVTDLLSKIPQNIMDILFKAFIYCTLGCGAVFALFFFITLFYNINYPGKYEAIYDLRRARLKSFHNSDDRIAYKKRFYNDYKKGNWISMMLDLHFQSLEKGSTEPMRRDAYEFLVYYACLCDSTIKRAVFDEYAAHGRYFEVRNIFHDLKEKSDSIRQGGARIHIPTYVEPSPKPRKKTKVKPADVPKRIPPFAPKSYKKTPDARLKTWSPDDI